MKRSRSTRRHCSLLRTRQLYRADFNSEIWLLHLANLSAAGRALTGEEKDTRRHSSDLSFVSGSIHLRTGQQHRPKFLNTVESDRTKGDVISQRKSKHNLCKKQQIKSFLSLLRAMLCRFCINLLYCAVKGPEASWFVCGREHGNRKRLNQTNAGSRCEDTGQ